MLRRAGVEVTVASVENEAMITASRGVRIVADTTIGALPSTADFDAIVLPGGMPGAERLRDTPELVAMLERQEEAGLLLGAICAAPAVVLEGKGLVGGREATCHPAFVDGLSNQTAADTRVVLDGNLLTSRGPGTAFEFALKLVELLCDRGTADAVAAPMVLPP